MTYSELSSYLLQTIYGGPYPLTRAVLDETSPEVLRDIVGDLLDYATMQAQAGRPVFTAEQYSRAVVLQHWEKYRDQPSALFIDGGVR